MMKPEGKVKKQIRDFLKQQDVWHFCPQGGRFGTSGIPDIVGCYEGKFFAVEVKAPGKIHSGLTALQNERIAEIRFAGGKSCVTDSIHDFITWFDDVFL